MPEKILESVLNGQLDVQLVLKWLRDDDLEGVGEDSLLRRCGRNEFTAYFLSFLRAETDSIVDSESGARVVASTGTPERSEGRVHRRTASDPTDTPARTHHSPSKEKKRSGRKVKTKLFSEDRSKEPVSPDDGRLTTGLDRLALATSTPVKNDSERSSPRVDSTRSPAQPTTLADFLTAASREKSSRKKKNNNKSIDDSRESKELDVSSDCLAPPSANTSARKSSSLRSDKRRIKPTNIDLSKKSISLNSFNSEFQKVGALALENNEVFSAPPLLAGGSFSSSPGFAAERDALRRERHRLLEKFSSLSAATSPKCTTPLIKISQEDDNFVYPDVTKVTSEEKIQVLVDIYQVLLDCNLVLSYTNELCFLLALVRGRQRVEAVSTTSNSVLRTIHNASCFAARTLRTQRTVLAALLDRPSLRALAEAKATKTMAPDLSKSLLDVYGLLGESGSGEPAPATNAAGHVVAWNSHTDGADNFPSALSFHTFKRQRDMFYEIARWYGETGGTGTPSLRTRVRALLSLGAGAGGSGGGTGGVGGGANIAHLGVLVARHALNLPGCSQGQESRLSKLQRRLTRPSGPQANALFTPEEEFYRDLLSCTENEPFRCAVRDALANELLVLDSAPVHTGAGLVSLTRCTITVGKLFALLAALPYCPQAVTSQGYRPLPYIIALRSYAVPSLDIYGLLSSAIQSGRLCVTLPWTCAYLHTLATLDPAATRLPPYTKLLATLTQLYRHRLPMLPARTALYLRCTLSTLFAQPNIPQEILYEENQNTDDVILSPPRGLDNSDVITETELAGLLAARREIASLLAGGGGGARHVTPLRVGPSPNRATQRYTLIQKRLEEAVVRSCGGTGARRVLELVCERVSAATLTNCSRALSAHRHKPTAVCDVTDIAQQGKIARDKLEAGLGALVCERGLSALSALAERAVRARLLRHTTTGELCEAASGALRTLVGTSWREEAPTNTQAHTTHTDSTHVYVHSALIELKETVCLTLEHSPPDMDAILSTLESLHRGIISAGSAGVKGVKRAALQLSVDICVALACTKPDYLTDDLLLSCERIWRLVPRITPQASAGEDRMMTPKAVNTSNSDKGPEPESDDITDIFGNLISNRVIQQISRSKHGTSSWDALKRLILFATSRGWLSPNQLTESCVALYRRDWPQEVLTPLANCVRGVSGAGGDGGLELYLGFLGDYCHDLEFTD